MSQCQALVPTLLQLDRLPRSLSRDAILVLSGTLFLALLAQISIPLPFTPVPITGQSLGVLLCGGALGSKRGTFSTLLYLALGALGAPFFAGGASGWQLMVGPTGGYLLGFVLSAYVCGKLAERGHERSFRKAIPAFLAGQICLYAVGLPWLGLFVGFENVLMKGLVPFLPGLVIKSTLAGLVLPSAWKIARR